MSTINYTTPSNEPHSMNTDVRNMTAAFTGHRSLPNDISRLKAETEKAVKKLIAQGVVFYGCGGAVGFDACTARLILELRDTLYPQIKLIQVLPFKGMESKWTPEQQRDFNEINEKADKVVYLAEKYTGNEVYHVRNRYLVDHASHLIAYCRNTQARSGTASCYRYAVKQNINIILIGD